MTGDLRVTSSPNPEVTLTVKTPWNNWEQMSVNGGYQDDGWGKKEVSLLSLHCRLHCVHRGSLRPLVCGYYTVFVWFYTKKIN